MTGIRLSPVGSGGRIHTRAQRGNAGSLGGGGHRRAQSGVRGRARGGGAALRGPSTATSRPTTGANGRPPRAPTTGNGAAHPVRAASPAAAPLAASMATTTTDDIGDDDEAMIAAFAAAEAACGNAADDNAADTAPATDASTTSTSGGERPVRAAGAAASAALAAGAAADGDPGAALRGDRRAQPGVQITAAQAEAVRAWLALRFAEWGGRCPRNA